MAHSNESATTNASDTKTTAPVVIDLGKTRKSRVKDLKQGRGKLVDEVADAVEEVRSRMGAEARDKVLVPVVIIYQKKARKRGGNMRLPFSY